MRWLVVTAVSIWSATQAGCGAATATAPGAAAQHGRTGQPNGESADMTDSVGTAAQKPDDLNHRWNLADIYPSDAAWTKALEEANARLPELAAFQGKLSESAGALADGLDLLFQFDRLINRLYAYAAKRSDEDTRAAEPLQMRQRAGRLATDFQQKASFVEPEILALGKQKVEIYIATEPRLAVYSHYLDNTLRQQPHTLDAAGEKIIAAAGLMADTASTTYSILANAEIPWPTVTLADDTAVRLDQSAYSRYRAVANRADREAVFRAFWGKWAEYEQTMGVALYSQLKRDVFYKQVRNYPTCLANALDGDNIPESVYRTLIEITNANLGTLHRYFRLRARMLGIEGMRYHDIYPPLVQTDLAFPIEMGQRMVIDAVDPLGEPYASTVREGFAGRWMDTFPRKGKRSGAYSSGAAYDVHPYVLMNYNDDYESVSTLAHEWGHALHSWLANKTQPYPKAHYATFVAEVASTFNEALLLDHVLKAAKTDQEKLYYLGFALEGLRGTFFRQTMFAEFELKIHELVESGEALTGKRFTSIYGEILRRYHGHDDGVVTIDDAYAIEWAYVPHFYYNFYVYQYATSLAAASLFAQDVLDGKEGAAERYRQVLESGGARYPYEMLKEAGVDLATAAPYEALLRRMIRIMDQIEAILDH